MGRPQSANIAPNIVKTLRNFVDSSVPGARLCEPDLARETAHIQGLTGQAAGVGARTLARSLASTLASTLAGTSLLPLVNAAASWSLGTNQ